ncbi:molybdopterin-dependent oxidoreductase [Dyadobacter luticola]|uniref:Molybdopterin-binding oxidoreductase n=1 Tax=Dyadobacter luticola TaxID=1979387 RepID=A0A5R9L522_9BACT|nr:molybdopterin-dependent oxidoreductase [Dyadobacter luticola]TLV03375.1 molybdopterin-binding oxidoreductase [Dyadobacter luticola]
MENQKSAEEIEEEKLDRKLNRRNFLSFATFAAVGAAAVGGWKWLYHADIEPRKITGFTREPLRDVLNKNETLFRKFFSHDHLVKTYPKSEAVKNVRINSLIGLEKEGFDADTWELNVQKSKDQILKLRLDDLKKLPKTEIVFDFKCVEGWDQIQHWGGVKFADFMAHYQLHNQAKMEYVGMKTPNSKYYIGMDMESALHPQTILAYEMNGRPLTIEHGAPLRLIVPVKYGIKNLKRIGTISFSNERPPDFWARLGYDYYSGL